jgi:hypothetical protein
MFAHLPRIALALACAAASLYAVIVPPSYSGVLTFSTSGAGDVFHPNMVQDLDLSTNALAVRFTGLDATRARSGETAYLQRLSGGLYADHGVVVADAQGVPGAPVFVCKQFQWSTNRVCSSPKVTSDGRRVAFVSISGGGSVCKDGYGMFWAGFVVVTDRRGAVIARFEGYYDPEWLPDGRLLMMGSACRGAGIWVADPTLRQLSRVDGGRVATPASAPAINPDGRRLAFVWNSQVWALSLGARSDGADLTQLTALAKPVTAAAWSPDGGSVAALMFDVSMPVRAVALFHPGDQRSMEFRQLPLYPYGPISWR